MATTDNAGVIRIYTTTYTSATTSESIKTDGSGIVLASIALNSGSSAAGADLVTLTQNHGNLTQVRHLVAVTTRLDARVTRSVYYFR